MSADIDRDDDRTVVPLSDQQAQAFWREFSRQLPALQALDGHGFVSTANEVLNDYAPGLAIELEPESPEKRRGEEEEDEEEEPELFARYLVHTPAAGAARKRPSSSTIFASG